MGVAGELEVDAVADGVFDDDGLVGDSRISSGEPVWPSWIQPTPDTIRPGVQ